MGNCISKISKDHFLGLEEFIKNKTSLEKGKVKPRLDRRTRGTYTRIDPMIKYSGTLDLLQTGKWWRHLFSSFWNVYDFFCTIWNRVPERNHQPNSGQTGFVKTIAIPGLVGKQSFFIDLLSLFWYPASNELHCYCVDGSNGETLKTGWHQKIFCIILKGRGGLPPLLG